EDDAVGERTPERDLEGGGDAFMHPVAAGKGGIFSECGPREPRKRHAPAKRCELSFERFEIVFASRGRRRLISRERIVTRHGPIVAFAPSDARGEQVSATLLIRGGGQIAEELLDDLFSLMRRSKAHQS